MKDKMLVDVSFTVETTLGDRNTADRGREWFYVTVTYEGQMKSVRLSRDAAEELVYKLNRILQP